MGSPHWAVKHITDLNAGKTVSFRPVGRSMSPRIESGNLVTVSPDVSNLKVDDIVLCTVKGRDYVHLIKAIAGRYYTIGNNRGGTNGDITIDKIHGKVISVGP